jgi:hypothetical protein
MEKLEGFLPFLREHLAFLDVDRSIDVCRQYQQVVNPRYRFSGPLRRILPTFPVRSPHRNIFLTGGMTFAGFGFEGEVLSGIKAGYHATGGAEI